MGDFKKIAVLIAGIAASILLGMLAFALPWPTPGAYLTYWVFPPGASGGGYDLGSVLLMHIGVDSLCCFVLLSGAYFLLGKRYLVGGVREVALVIGGIALSILLAMFAVSPSWPTPGAYLAHTMFPSGHGPNELRSESLVRLAANSLCCFAVVSLSYILVTKDWSKK